MNSFLIVLFWCLVGAQSKCIRTPADTSSYGCTVGNLTVIADPMNEIINETICNIKVDQSFFNFPPTNVTFNYYVLRYTPAPKYLLMAVDVTSKQLIWMMSNLTLGHNLSIIPNHNGYHRHEVIPWHKPQLNLNSTEHVIEFLVFEEYRNHNSKLYAYDPSIQAVPFNFSNWANSQHNSGIEICGPVGVGSVVALRSSQPRDENTDPPTNKGNSNRNLFKGVLLAAVVLILAFLNRN